MAVVKRVHNVLIVSAVIIAVLILVVIGVTLFARSVSVEPIILKTIELRNAEDSVKRAQLISELDELVMAADNAALSEQWSRVTSCLGAKCPDDAFFDTIFVAASEFQGMLPNADLVMHVLFVNRYWDNDERVVEFSKSLAAVDAQMPHMQDRQAERAWSKVVECNNECGNKNDLYFDALAALAK